MSLRSRVVLGSVAVLLVLLVADLALIGTFRGFLMGRVDQQLTQTTTRLVDFVTRPGRVLPRERGTRGGVLDLLDDAPLSEYFVGLADRDGVVYGRLNTPLRDDLSLPRADADLITANATAQGEPLRPFTVGGTGRDAWRLVAVEPASFGGGIVVVGASLVDVGPTFRRMIVVLAAATLAVAVMLAVVAWWVLRQGVRPLVEMTGTAQAIAGGAMGARVADTDERTEAGRLGAALNTMLGRIESAFAQRAASEKRLRQFVADASHELRTPLTSIRGYAELHRAGALSDADELAGAMRRIEQEADRMGGLVDDLLLLAKLDQQRPLRSEPVDLAAVAADAVADLRAVEPERPVELDARPVTVIGDEAQLRQAIGNLLANTRTHTPPDTPVKVRVDADDGQATVEVADRGPGMPPEVASRVFERFYRADRARSRARGGSGLGLAIVAGVAEAHGGNVEVDTQEGRGARFTIRLPR